MEIINNFLNFVLILGFIFAVYYFYVWIKSHAEAKSMKDTKRNLEDKAFFEANSIVDKFIMKRKDFINSLNENNYSDLTSFFEKFLNKQNVISFEEKINFLKKIDEINIKIISENEKLESNHD